MRVIPKDGQHLAMRQFCYTKILSNQEADMRSSRPEQDMWGRVPYMDVFPITRRATPILSLHRDTFCFSFLSRKHRMRDNIIEKVHAALWRTLLFNLKPCTSSIYTGIFMITRGWTEVQREGARPMGCSHFFLYHFFLCKFFFIFIFSIIFSILFLAMSS
jgi:hypothetical protein